MLMLTSTLVKDPHCWCCNRQELYWPWGSCTGVVLFLGKVVGYVILHLGRYYFSSWFTGLALFSGHKSDQHNTSILTLC
jgi:hypothetical protein